MSDALPCIATDLLTHGDGVVVVFGLMFAAVIVGGVWGFLGPRLAVPLDRAYRWLWRLPECKPGHCCCRRTCIYIHLEPLE
ncbi:hypothetical protein SOM22_13970 [Stenotrophomonas rhizophila]|uniref:hypothetical protein n=1 Tax=Stenotrophomonas rhizophila TaxID=216778 RepID=UPI002A69BD55|nr:hypothetical protein [Stenotrophomonas rhizophila]MDY0955680.1 hypothetical protein [Stenotrophomonas rhizophila]